MICQRRSSRPPSNKDLAALVLPSSLNRVSPFLQEAQSCFRDETKADSKIVVYCVDHAVSYLLIFNVKSPFYLSCFVDCRPLIFSYATPVVDLIFCQLDLISKFNLRLDDDSRVLLGMFVVKRNTIAELYGMTTVTEEDLRLIGDNSQQDSFLVKVCRQH